jgi:hypothetical protein
MSGVTRSIREQLNFTDDKRWKEFSTRRLELIDKFNLSSKKASEQDDAIRQIADLLRQEFGFPTETLQEFDKLVRAAVQSVRRNRKRSSRARVNNDRFIQYEDKPLGSISRHTTGSLFQQQPLPHMKSMDLGINSLLSTSAGSTPSTSSIGNSPPQTHLPSIRSLTDGAPPTVSSSSIALPLPLTLPQSGKDLTPSRQKMLNYIQKSKSCLLLSNNDPLLHEENLQRLGSGILIASISFILERFFADISTDSINYLSEKLQSTSNLAKVLKSLGFFSSDVMVLTDLQANSLLAKLIGCCVKDFGFDHITYALSEVFHEIILNEYPLIATQVTKITPESLYAPLMPMKPKDADSEVSKEVQLQYGHRVLNFKYAPLSSAPPTYLELLENGKTAFGIQNKNMRLRFDGEDITEDRLDKKFKDIELKNIALELYELPSQMKFTPLL